MKDPENNCGSIDWANEYGEPGYGDAPKGILLANWNKVPKPILDRLEHLGYKLEWSDEWYVEYDNSPVKAWRTSPDSHYWESRVRCCDGYMLTPDSAANEWIEDSLNDNQRPLPSWFDQAELESRGFTTDDESKEVGFHLGQNDEPHKFTPSLREKGLEFVLQITGRGQFDVAYRIWTRMEQQS
jgi:hypothetical protein